MTSQFPGTTCQFGLHKGKCNTDGLHATRQGIDALVRVCVCVNVCMRECVCRGREDISRDNIAILSLIERLQRQGGMRGGFQIDLCFISECVSRFKIPFLRRASNQNERFRFL